MAALARQMELSNKRFESILGSTLTLAMSSSLFFSFYADIACTSYPSLIEPKVYILTVGIVESFASIISFCINISQDCHWRILMQNRSRLMLVSKLKVFGIIWCVACICMGAIIFVQLPSNCQTSIAGYLIFINVFCQSFFIGYLLDGGISLMETDTQRVFDGGLEPFMHVNVIRNTRGS